MHVISLGITDVKLLKINLRNINLPLKIPKAKIERITLHRTDFAIVICLQEVCDGFNIYLLVKASNNEKLLGEGAKIIWYVLEIFWKEPS